MWHLINLFSAQKSGELTFLDAFARYRHDPAKPEPIARRMLFEGVKRRCQYGSFFWVPYGKIDKNLNSTFLKFETLTLGKR